MIVNFYLDAYEDSSDDLYIRIFDGEDINLLINEFLSFNKNYISQFKYSLKRCLEAHGSVVVKISVSIDGDDIVMYHPDYNLGKLLSIDNFQSFLEVIDNHSHSRAFSSRKSKIIEMLLNGSLSEYYFVPEEQEKEKEFTEKKEEKINNNNERGSVMKTNNLFGNIIGKLKFGKIQTDEIAYSMQGIAYKTKDGDYVCYNTETEELLNVSQMIFNMPIVVMPLSKKDLKVGDIIQHNNQFVIVKEISDKDKGIKIIKPNEQETAVIIPMKSIFGFDFYSKVINIFENVSIEADQNNPFGNMLPLLMMGNKENNDSLLPIMMMMNNGNKDINSMLPLLMMSDKENTDSLLPMMMMMNNNKDMNSMLPLLMMGGEKDMTSILMMMMLNK